MDQISATVTFLSTSYVEGILGQMTFRMGGEALLPGYGSPSFVGYLSTLSISDGAAKRHASEVESDAIKEGITRYMKERNQTVEFEP
ncbi:MAG: hypothetical protein ACRYGF_13355 [Janthinobacterium lividum]